MNRRTVLTGAAVAGTVPFLGCLGTTSGGPGGQGTEGMPTRLWLERVSLTESEREAVAPIVFAELTEAEQGIVRTALDAEEYTTETENESPALERLRDRIENRADGSLEVYLVHGDTFYRVGFAAGDNIIAHPSG
jgi:hypothetical protein